MDPVLTRLGRTLAASAGLWIAPTIVTSAYTLTGGASRDILVDEMLSNLLLVLGFQVFIGNTGVLSFGHMAFVQIAAYATAVVAIPIATKEKSLPDIPFGLADVHLGPFAATVFAVVVTTGGDRRARRHRHRARQRHRRHDDHVGAALRRRPAREELGRMTRGAGGLSGVPMLGGSRWIYAAAFLGLVVAHWFQETRIGRFAVATREDELAAPALGIRLTTSRWVAWTVSIALVSFGGALRAQSLGSVNPKQFTLDAGIVILAMLIVGGMRTISGASSARSSSPPATKLFRQLGDPQRLDIERFPDVFSVSRSSS